MTLYLEWMHSHTDAFYEAPCDAFTNAFDAAFILLGCCQLIIKTGTGIHLGRRDATNSLRDA
jgi:hypothetical protein